MMSLNIPVKEYNLRNLIEQVEVNASWENICEDAYSKCLLSGNSELFYKYCIDNGNNCPLKSSYTISIGG